MGLAFLVQCWVPGAVHMVGSLNLSNVQVTIQWGEIPRGQVLLIPPYKVQFSSISIAFIFENWCLNMGIVKKAKQETDFAQVSETLREKAVPA